jgi:ribonuclease Z
VSFKVTILGCGGALPTNNRNASSQYIECNNRHILIDCGEGTQMQIRKFGIHFQRITHILISHLHGDHFFGLPGLLSTMNLLGRNTGITIYGPSNLHGLLNDIFSSGGQQLNFKLNFVALDFKEEKVIFEDKLIRIKSFPLNHRIPTCGFKIEEKTKEYSINSEVTKELAIPLKDYPKLKRGENIVLENGIQIDFQNCVFEPKKPRSYAYCSDTYPSDKYLNSIQGVDILYHEATFTEELADRAKSTLHSTAKKAAEVAKKAKVKQMIIGHFSSRYKNGEAHLLEATQIFKETVVAEDGMEIDLLKII